jgi:prolyl-tRNA synthetase
MKRGRPTLHSQREIKEIILEYYEQNISAKVASRNSGINRKTVLKYYKVWNTEMIELSEDFLLRIKITKEKTIESLDRDIISLNSDEKTMEYMKKRAMNSGSLAELERLTKLKLKIMDQRVKIQTAKINLIGTPTADIIINQNGVRR